VSSHIAIINPLKSTDGFNEGWKKSNGQDTSVGIVPTLMAGQLRNRGFDSRE
jgi:hypothetical protein